MNYYPKSVTKHFIKNILNQMENYFFKINDQNDKFNIGFFLSYKL